MKVNIIVHINKIFLTKVTLKPFFGSNKKFLIFDSTMSYI